MATKLRGMVALCLLSLPIAMASANTVELSRSGRDHAAIGLADFTPSHCSGLGLSTLSTGNGAITGGATNDLILGGPAAQTLAGGEGDDCILGGGGDDVISGGPGNDVCIGGPGTNTFDPDCETTI